MDKLEDFLDHTTSLPVDDTVRRFAEEVAARCANPLAVLVYGSTLRGVPLDDTLVDFYVLVATRRDVATSQMSSIFASILPPNVYYGESEVAGRKLRCKYAIVALQDFAAWNEAATANPYFWARFSQPVSLIHAHDQGARERVIKALAEAVRTANRHALALDPDPVRRWQRLYQETYQTELRPESRARGSDVVASNRDYYAGLSALAGDAGPLPANWPLRRIQGKVLSVARLMKAAFTFQGGVDYAAWKIERHSGQKIMISPWQRNHPIVAGLLLLPRLLRKGTLR